MANVIRETPQSHSTSIEQKINWAAQLMQDDGTLKTIENIAVMTEKLEIHASVNNMYVYGHWILTANSDLIDNISENNITIGSSIYFRFLPAISNDTVNMELKVLSITVGAGVSASTLGNSFNILLISPWYFSQASSSHAYYGNVPTVIKQMFKDDYIYDPGSYLNSLSGFRIGGNTVDVDTETGNSSSDLPAPRYRTMQKPSDFIKDRLRKYYRGIDNTSSFIFTNIDDNFEVLCYSDMSKLSKYVAIDYSNPQIAGYKQWQEDPYLSKLLIYPHSRQLYLNSGEGHNLWDVLIPALIYYYRNGGYVKGYADTPQLNVLGYDKENKVTYVNQNRSSNVSKIYIDDTFHDFDDIISMKVNEYNADLLSAHKFKLVCMPNLFILAGRICNLNILTSESQSSLFYQDYIISEVTHVFSGITCRTELTLETTSLTLDDSTKSHPLFHA
ncbi:MAG: hypothetical protein WCP55_17295 [Lentisphaerota bacterium]